MAEKHPHSSCLTCPRRSETEWSGLSDDELALVDKFKRDLHLKAGEVLYHQGDECTGIYCIRDGLIGERRINADGKSVLVRLSHPGTTIGYQELLSKTPHINSAEVLRPSHVCFMNRGLIRDLLRRDPSLGERFLRRSLSDFRHLEDDYFIARTMDVQSRFLHVLMVFYEQFGTEDEDAGHMVDLPINRQDIAALVGTAPESLSRAARRIEEAGLVEFTGKRVRFRDLDALFDRIAVAEG